MPGAGRVGDRAFCPADAHGCPGCPHSVTGPAVSGSSNVLINGKPALRVGDMGIHAACCGANNWEAATDSATVLINGLPAHRVGDMTRHCGGVGTLVEGSTNVFIGGPSTSAGTSYCAATPEQIKEIQGLIDAGKHQEAIDKAVQYYGVNVSNVDGKVLYDPNRPDAATWPDRRVRVRKGHFQSPGWLASSIAHESEVHVNKQAMAGNWYNDQDGWALQEVEAYDYEIANAKRFGLTSAEIEELKQTRKSYYNSMSPAYQRQADKGIYTRP